MTFPIAAGEIRTHPVATSITKPTEPASEHPELEPIDTSNWPPMSDEVRAAWIRMEQEPHLLDEFNDDDWVAFSGDEIVASGPDHDEVIKTAEQAGKPVTLMVPIMGDWL